MDEKKYDLQQRLSDFALLVAKIVDKLPNDRFAAIIANQLTRSSTSPALNYGEAQAAESRKDFVHKMKVCLKELRETFISLSLIHKRNYKFAGSPIEEAIRENDQLIAIFVTSIKTANSNDDLV
jgi:four helix bundle protein